MDIVEEIDVGCLLMRRMRKSTDKRKPQKESLTIIFQEREEKVFLYFFIVSASASSSWILHLLVLPMSFCQNFCGLILWLFSLKLSDKFTNPKNYWSLVLMILNKTHAVVSVKHENIKED